MKKKNSKKDIPTYGDGKDLYVCTRPRGEPQNLCFGRPDNPAHGKGAVMLYRVYADTWEEALAIHKRVQGFN